MCVLSQTAKLLCNYYGITKVLVGRYRSAYVRLRYPDMRPESFHERYAVLHTKLISNATTTASFQPGRTAMCMIVTPRRRQHVMRLQVAASTTGMVGGWLFWPVLVRLCCCRTCPPRQYLCTGRGLLGEVLVLLGAE